MSVRDINGVPADSLGGSFQHRLKDAKNALGRKDYDGAMAIVAAMTGLTMAKATGALAQGPMSPVDRLGLLRHLLLRRTASLNPAAMRANRAMVADLLLRSVDGDRGLIMDLAQGAEIQLNSDELDFVRLVRALLDRDMADALRLAARRPPPVLIATRLLAARVMAAAGQPLQALLLLRSKHDPRLRRELQHFESYAENLSLHLQDDVVTEPGCRTAVCAVLKNEAADVEEWVNFHRAIGVERFFLYENGSTDATLAKLSELAKHVPIQLFRVPDQPAQSIAYRHFLAFHRLEARWVAFIDGDEFLNLERHDQLDDALDAAGDAAAIACNWRLFGSNGHTNPPAEGCLRGFTRRAAAVHPHIKMIVRPAKVIRYLNPHHFIMDGPTVTGAGRPVYPLQGMVDPAGEAVIAINHYIVKSRAQWLNKRARGRPMKGDDPARFRTDAYFAAYDRNEVEDLSILRLVRPPAQDG